MSIQAHDSSYLVLRVSECAALPKYVLLAKIVLLVRGGALYIFITINILLFTIFSVC